MTLLSFHGSQDIKEKYIAKVKEHKEADNIIQGTGWSNGKGCAVGCTLEDYDHSQYPIELGIPEWLAYLEDDIFEGLSNEDAKDWPLSFLESIPVGVDLDQVKIPFLIFIVEPVIDKFDHVKFPAVLSAINKVLNVLKNSPNDKIAISDAAGAAAIAESEIAAWAAGKRGEAWEAWEAWAEMAALAALAACKSARKAVEEDEDDEDEVALAAWKAAGAAWKAEREHTYSIYSDKLLELLKNCK